MNILLYCATNPIYPYVCPLTLQCMWAQQWDDPIDVLFGLQVAGESAHHYEDLNDKMNRARATVLSGDYDALFVVEADMIIPPDALSRLIALDTDVAYGLYCSRHNRRDGQPHKWLAFQHADQHASISWSQHPVWAVKRKVWGKVIETHGLGFGCTLIRRHVLESFSFRTHATHAVSNDWMFSLDCQAHNFKQMHDFGCICGHILADNKRAVWPTVDEPNLYRIEELDNGISDNSNFGNTQEKASLRAQERVNHSWAGTQLHAG